MPSCYFPYGTWSGGISVLMECTKGNVESLLEMHFLRAFNRNWDILYDIPKLSRDVGNSLNISRNETIAVGENLITGTNVPKI